MPLVLKSNVVSAHSLQIDWQEYMQITSMQLLLDKYCFTVEGLW
jgi:hypothetical protein